MPEFNPKHYIQDKKHGPSNKIPIQVQSDSDDEILSLPESAAALLPLVNIPIAQFITIELPQVTSGFMMYKTNSWFSEEEPNFVDIATLRHRPVPNDCPIFKGQGDNYWRGIDELRGCHPVQ
jgi:hypothetical protein